MKVMVVNAGSSSVKFQLFEMPEEKVIAAGVVERIGIKDSIYTIKFNGKKNEQIMDVKDHNEAVEMILKDLVSLGILKSLDEIKGVGHRIVQGGEFFKSSVLLTEEYIQKIDELAQLAPQRLYLTYQWLLYLIQHSIKQWL